MQLHVYSASSIDPLSSLLYLKNLFFHSLLERNVNQVPPNHGQTTEKSNKPLISANMLNCPQFQECHCLGQNLQDSLRVNVSILPLPSCTSRNLCSWNHTLQMLQYQPYSLEFLYFMPAYAIWWQLQMFCVPKFVFLVGTYLFRCQHVFKTTYIQWLI